MGITRWSVCSVLSPGHTIQSGEDPVTIELRVENVTAYDAAHVTCGRGIEGGVFTHSPQTEFMFSSIL